MVAQPQGHRASDDLGPQDPSPWHESFSCLHEQKQGAPVIIIAL